MLNLKANLVTLLERLPNKSSEAEANVILFHVFQFDYPEIRNFADLLLTKITPTKSHEAEISRIVKERLKGRPLQHILGNHFFLNHQYTVNEHVLVPRPETEILVETIFNWAPKDNFNFAELGLGSGIVSTELLDYFPKITGVATEVSRQAIAVARLNLKNIIGEKWEDRFQIIEPKNASVGFEALKLRGPFSIIVSNPPYLSVRDEIDPEVVKHEPSLALFPTPPKTQDILDENPNYFYQNFLEQAHQLLKPEAAVFFEVPHERALSISEMFKKTGFSSVNLINDLTGRPRVLFAKNLDINSNRGI